MVMNCREVQKLYNASLICGFIEFMGYASPMVILLTSLYAYRPGRGVKWRSRQVSVRQAVN